MYFTRNWEFGSALSKLRNFGLRGGVRTPLTTPTVSHWFFLRIVTLGGKLLNIFIPLYNALS
jgi:hypothetical protein